MSEEASTSAAAGASSEEEKVGLTEEHFNLMAQAYDEFNGKRYNNCLETLTKLEESVGCDTKIAHNKALVEFYSSDCKNYKKFLEFLDKEISEFNRLKDNAKNRNLFTIHFNKAVIYYHLRKPFAAIEQLNPIVIKFDDLDGSVASKAGFLYLTLLLETNQLKKALTFSRKLEGRIGVLSDNSTAEEGINSSVLLSTNDSDNSKRTFRLLSLLANIVNKENVIVPEDMSFDFSMLKAHQYFIGNDFQMAAKQLSKKFSLELFTVNSRGEDPNTYIANNMGIIHLRVKHYAIAADFFQHAIGFDNKAIENINDVPIYVVGATKKPEILYNLGISFLHLQRPHDAFKCFLIPLKMYHENPRLWLRISEACIMAHEQKIKETENKNVIASVIGSGVHRKYVLEPTPKYTYSSGSHVFENPAPTLEFAAKSLRNAVLLAEYHKEDFTDNSKTDDGKSLENIEDTNFCNPSPPISKESFDKLLTTIYAALSYVSIQLGDYYIGLEYAKKLLNMENLSDAYIMLGRFYCAESLIHIDKVSEARAYLEPELITNLNPHDFEIKNWKITSLEAAQAVFRYNLAVTLVFQGEFGMARTVLNSCNHPVLATKHKMLNMFIDLAVDSPESSKMKTAQI